MQITLSDLQRSERRGIWSFSNEVLYELCRSNPEHVRDEVIIAKILLIGRVYAAAIERRRNKDSRGDIFYTSTVAPSIRNSGIDAWLRALPAHESFDEKSTSRILKTHQNVTALFAQISGLDKRSLASKYLHFHRPDLFFIYDSRSMSAVRAATPARLQGSKDGFEPVYASFFRRCLWLRQEIEKLFKHKLSPRQLDDLLITLSENLASKAMRSSRTDGAVP